MPAAWIRRHDRFDELDSTSSHLARIWRDGSLSPEDTPILVTTQCQTAGRGRGDHRWFSDSGSLTFTLGLRPAEYGLKLADLVPIGLLTAYSLIESIESLFQPLAGQVGIRWPNDIECDAGKIGGILPECIQGADHQPLLLIGIGINVATDLSSGPDDARRIGIALDDLLPPHSHRPDAAETLLAHFLGQFPKSLKKLADPESDWINDAHRFDRLAGTAISARQGEDMIRGVAQGWDSHGRLIVARESGGTVLVSSGQILRSLE